MLKAASGPTSLLPGALFLMGAAALALGLYGRFKGIGTWPFGVDEFYISRSVDNIMRRGVPQFACGGYYSRGLLFQYLIAAMRLSGMSAEPAGRLLAALSSLAVLPAAYLLARRIAGPLAGCLTVIILCISVWEIEMARFARMYAPFQAVFTWYLVFYLRYVVDREEAALGWMAALSVAGMLLWEGGVFLAAANLLAVILVSLLPGRPRSLSWPRLAGLILLLALSYLATRDLRGFAQLPAASGGVPDEVPTHLQLALGGFAPLAAHPIWLCVLLLPLGLSCAALSWLWSLRSRWMTAAGLCIVLACAAAHVFTLAAGVLALMLLADLIDRHALAAGRGRYFVGACIGFLLFWAAFYHWAGTPPSALAARLFGFPDVYDNIVRPWGRTLPLLSTGLALALAFWSVRTLSTAPRPMDSVAALLILVVAVALAVGAAGTERVETRYTFFLYPLLWVFAVSALVQLRRYGVPLAVAASGPLLCFAASEDFQPRHVLHIDSPAINFRTGMSAVRAAHYYPRDDVRAIGAWLTSHRPPGAVVVADIASLEQYYPDFDYFFLEEQDPRYEAYVCKDGATERWTDHRVLYGLRALEPLVASGRPVYASLFADDELQLRSAAKSEGWSVTSVWSSPYGNADVLLIAPAGSSAGTP